ncbi:MAG: hypothetical protein PHZ19_03980 [Candidatus Thermoplasmatota archaeon]|nr:hypothetical protein [Candidatus Thermoplasmatota archaeon]
MTPLPGERDRPFSPPQKLRLAIGETYQRGNQTLPRKADHWTVRRLSCQTGQKPTYIIDHELQALLCKAVGVTEKPTEVPVTVIGNATLDADGRPHIPESILFGEMARYFGGRRECACGEWGADGRGTAHRRYYEQRKAKGADRTYTVLTREEDVVCDPAACPFATGQHDLAKHEGVALCKPHVIASVMLPWAPSVGTAAKFKTTGWNSYFSMRDSLLTIALQTQGWLHEVPLALVLEWARSADGHLVPSVRFEFRGNVEELRRLTIPKLRAYQEQGDTIKQLQAGVVSAVHETLSDHDEAEATQAEFYPEAEAVNGQARAAGRVSRLPVDDGIAEGEFEPEAEPEPVPPAETDTSPGPTPSPSELVIVRQRELMQAGINAADLVAAVAAFRAEIAPDTESLSDVNDEQAAAIIGALNQWATDELKTAKEEAPA